MAYPQTSVDLALAVAFDGMDGAGPHATDPYVNEEATAEIPFGTFVAQGVAVDAALKLAATTDTVLGVVMHSHKYAVPDQLGTTGIKPNVAMNVRSQGRAWVPVEDAVTPSTAVHVRAVSTGNEVAGACRGTADGADTIEITGWAKWLTSTTGAGRALLEFDARNRSA